MQDDSLVSTKKKKKKSTHYRVAREMRKMPVQ